jgi:RsiW-degrading membrane proteinase PrsW (M82 family)
MDLYSEILPILNNSFVILSYSLLAGVIPAIFWLWFWMHEETQHKEPRKIILLTFLLGMLGVFVTFLLQKGFVFYFNLYIENIEPYINFIHTHTVVNLIFVIIEEFIKYLCAYVVFFRTKLFREPIDAFIYLMTAAIGFTAMENTLYIIQPLINGQTIDVLINSNIRFIGASILHVTSSGLLALSIGYSFCKKPFTREVYIWFGLILAILLHWLFNFILLKYSNSVILVFSSVWIVSIFLILSLEKIKRIKC